MREKRTRQRRAGFPDIVMLNQACLVVIVSPARTVVRALPLAKTWIRFFAEIRSRLPFSGSRTAFPRRVCKPKF